MKGIPTCRYTHSHTQPQRGESKKVCERVSLCVYVRVCDRESEYKSKAMA